MKQQATFTGWDFAGVWDISENTTCPYFTWQALGPFAGAADLGSGWKWLSWLGYFSTSYDPWIFHLQHSWMFSVGTSPRSLWLYDLSLGWLWTSSTVYPYLYRSSDGAWLYYLKDSSPRWFYNFKTNGWWEDTK